MDSPLPLTPVVQIIAGLMILFLGRRLFWVFVGVIGFFAGLQFGMKIFVGIDELVLLAISIVIGLVCAGLALLLQRLAVAFAGGIIGGMLAMRVAPSLGLYNDGALIAFVVGALLAAVLISVLFDPALIVLSALTGALLIAYALPLDDMIAPIIFVICLVIGLVIQSRNFRRSTV